MLERLTYSTGLIGDELQLSLQVSRVGLMRWEWLAGRVEQRQGRVENYWGRGL